MTNKKKMGKISEKQDDRRIKREHTGKENKKRGGQRIKTMEN